MRGHAMVKVVEVEIILMQDTVLTVSGVVTSVRDGGKAQYLSYAVIYGKDEKQPARIVRMDHWDG